MKPALKIFTTGMHIGLGNFIAKMQTPQLANKLCMKPLATLEM